MNIFFTIFYQPIFNLLVYLYNVIPTHDLGLAIIALTLIIRLILYPLSKSSIKSQKALQSIQPEIDKIKEKYKNDKEKMGPELLALYKGRKINPFSSCLPLLIQLPFLFAVYRVFYNGLKKEGAMDALYPFVSNPGSLDPVAFGFLHLDEKSIILAVMAGAAQYWQSKMLINKKQSGGGAMGSMNKQMLYIMPIITILIGSRFPAGLTFYWLLTTLFTIAQQYIVLGRKNKKTTAEVVDSKK